MVKNEVFAVFFVNANVRESLGFQPFCMALVFLAIRWFKKHSTAWMYSRRHIINEVECG